MMDSVFSDCQFFSVSSESWNIPFGRRVDRDRGSPQQILEPKAFANAAGTVSNWLYPWTVLEHRPEKVCAVFGQADAQKTKR